MKTIKKACKGVSYPKSSSVSSRLGSPSKAKTGTSLGMKSVKAGYDSNPGVTRADIIVAGQGKAKKGKMVKKGAAKKPMMMAKAPMGPAAPMGGGAPMMKKGGSMKKSMKMGGKTTASMMKMGGKTKKCAYGCK
jgi:hypothetical protein